MSSAFAATRPVNPPDAQPSSPRNICGEASNIERLFLPNVLASKMITDGGNKIAQELTVENEDRTETEVLTETVQAHPSTIMYHEVSNGLRIVTVMSRGAAGELLLTFSFANRELPASKPKPTPEEENARIGKLLEKTIAMFREMVSEGKL
ncbi:hypothetical protein B0H13DRAFT_1873755 [Mycena leptocephala]|nr:hypothetical protein B0H13DRAFT_1873755 [Mycena leptocephala]